MSLTDHKAILAANERQPVSKKGSFIMLKSATGALTVEVDNQPFEMLPGDYAEVRGGFVEFFVNDKSGAANTAVFVVGDGDFRRLQVSGNVTITGNVSVQPVGGSMTVDDGGAPFTPHELLSGYFRGTVSAALNTIVTPAANVNGVMIYGVSGQVSASGLVRVMYKAGAPTSYADAAAVTIIQNAASFSVSGIALPVKVPAGMGVYEQCSSGLNQSFASLQYKVL